MKMRIKNAFLLPVLIAGLSWILADRVTAQVFTVLHTFGEASRDHGYLTNWDGAQPYQTGLVLSGNRLYGTTYYGGANGRGTVFSMNTGGNDFAVLHTFSASHSPDYTNLDGEFPQGGLVLTGDTLYGTTLNGGTNSGGYGTLFSVLTNGNNFTSLHSFNNASDGRNPNGPLVISDNRLFGASQSGTVFAMNSDGSDFTALHTLTNMDGGFPYSGLRLSGNTLYGTAEFGGAYGNGTLFSIQTNGVDFTVIHTFTAGIGPNNRTNADGEFPEAGLVLSEGTLYGTASFGGDYNNGALFSVSTNGSDFKVLHVFTGLDDGSGPTASLLLVGNTLYGTAVSGGAGDSGTVFSVNTDGSHFTVLHSFAPAVSSINSDGAYPECALVLSGNTLYGTTEQGGAYGNGTVFSLTLTPQLTITPSGSNLVLIWPTNSGELSNSAFVLQCTTNLASATAWTVVSPAPVVANGQYTVTNSITDANQFYRLKTN